MLVFENTVGLPKAVSIGIGVVLAHRCNIRRDHFGRGGQFGASSALLDQPKP